MLPVKECLQYVESKGKTKYVGFKEIKGRMKYTFDNGNEYTLKELRQAKKFLWLGGTNTPSYRDHYQGA